MAGPESFQLASLLLPPPHPAVFQTPTSGHLLPGPFLALPPPPSLHFSGLLHAQLQYLNYLSLLSETSGGGGHPASPGLVLSPAKPEAAALAPPATSPRPPPKQEPKVEEPTTSQCEAESSPVPSTTSSNLAPPVANFQEGVTVGYTYDALFVSDGRSKRKNAEGKKERYQCPQCQKSYATSSNLSRHKQTHRPMDSDQAKACPYGCGKIYVSMPALSMHILTHKLEHKCTVCGKAFSRPWLLQGHMRSHTGLKPFGCAHCGKAFSDRSNLRAHMQTHSGEKKFDCSACGKSFALKSYLNKHAETCRLGASKTPAASPAHSLPDPAGPLLSPGAHRLAHSLSSHSASA